MAKQDQLICPKCGGTNVFSNMSALTIGIGSFANEHKYRD